MCDKWSARLGPYSSDLVAGIFSHSHLRCVARAQQTQKLSRTVKGPKLPGGNLCRPLCRLFASIQTRFRSRAVRGERSSISRKWTTPSQLTRQPHEKPTRLPFESVGVKLRRRRTHTSVPTRQRAA